MTETPDSFAAQVERFDHGIVLKVRIRVPSGYTFTSGQYLEILTTVGALPLSIASAPAALPIVELHYQPDPADPRSRALKDALNHRQLEISSAQGDVLCPPTNEALLLIGGGIGASQAFSCIRHRLTSQQGSANTTVPNTAAANVTPTDTAMPTTTFLWCVDDSDFLYDLSELEAYAGLTLQTVVDADRSPQNKGLKWLRQRTMERSAANADKIANEKVILCGSPAFVYAYTDALLEGGYRQQQLASDVYAYAPR